MNFSNPFDGSYRYPTHQTGDFTLPERPSCTADAKKVAPSRAPETKAAEVESVRQAIRGLVCFVGRESGFRGSLTGQEIIDAAIYAIDRYEATGLPKFLDAAWHKLHQGDASSAFRGRLDSVKAGLDALRRQQRSTQHAQMRQSEQVRALLRHIPALRATANSIKDQVDIDARDHILMEDCGIENAHGQAGVVRSQVDRSMALIVQVLAASGADFGKIHEAVDVLGEHSPLFGEERLLAWFEVYPPEFRAHLLRILNEA